VFLATGVAGLVPEMASVLSAAVVPRRTNRTTMLSMSLLLFVMRIEMLVAAAVRTALGRFAPCLAQLDLRKTVCPFAATPGVCAVVASPFHHMTKANVGASIFSFSFAAVTFACCVPQIAPDFPATFKPRRSHGAVRRRTFCLLEQF
jgi:hypothetical protein